VDNGNYSAKCKEFFQKMTKVKMIHFFHIGFLSLLINMGFGKKEYHWEHYPDGGLKAQGWEEHGFREGYWKFYFPNGKLKEMGHFQMGKKSGYWYFYDQHGRLDSEGHYIKGKKAQWWVFYDEKERINHKCPFNKGIKNGYCLKYKGGKLESVVKYHNGTSLKQWHDLQSFKEDNDLSELR